MMTESDLHCMAMESQTAYRHMEEICKRLGYQFPPRLEQPNAAKRDALPDFFPTTTKHSHEAHSSSIC